MSNAKSLERIEVPKLQVYVEGDFDSLAERGILEGSIFKAEKHHTMLLEAVETPITVVVIQEEGALRLVASLRRTVRSFEKRMIEALVYDMESIEDFEGKSEIISSTVKEEKRVSFLRGLFQGYLQAEDAVDRLVQKNEINELDENSGILFSANLDSSKTVRGDERPKLKCYENNLFTSSQKVIEATPYNKHYFSMNDGILKKYEGVGGNVVIPEGVTEIGYSAFAFCDKLTSVTIPSSVTNIRSNAFNYCGNLERIEFHSVDVFCENNVFDGCLKLNILLPRGAGCTEKKLSAQLSKAAENMDEEELAWILLYQTAKAWKADGIEAAKKKDPVKVFEKQMDLIEGKKRITSAAATNVLDTCLSISQELSEENVKRIARLLREKNCTKQLATIEEDMILREKLLGSEAASNLNPVEKKIKEIMDAENSTAKTLEERLNVMMGLKTENLPTLRDVGDKECNPVVLSWLLTAHERRGMNYRGDEITGAEWMHPGIRPEASEVVALLKPESLQEAINALADEHLVTYQNKSKKYLVYPFCRYADEASMAKLTKRAPSWATSVSGNDAPPLLQLRVAVRYSDTRAAMIFAERYQELDKYAALRAVSEDEIRDKYLSDVGLDEMGRKTYDLGNQTVIASLQKDLSFLFELPTGKTVKSLPKKNADPIKYEEAKADFDEMRKAVKKIVKSRCNRLFLDFLNGSKQASTVWKNAYLKNPLLRNVAELIVWEQNGKTFTLSQRQPINSEGQPYTITDAPIRIAHPMEMSAEEVKAWQKYFTHDRLKQPILQIWETVIDPATIRADRYQGSMQPMYRFVGKEKHGIHSGNLYAFSEDIGFTLDDCEIEYEASTWRIGPQGADEETYTLGNFSFKQYTRQVNHIVSLLDFWTVEDRIKKDDVSIADQLDSFTLAQITDFIRLAQETNVVSVLALLMDYKNTHFAEFDPMDEFTLDLI